MMMNSVSQPYDIKVTNIMPAVIKEEKPDIENKVEITKVISVVIKEEKPHIDDAISALVKEDKPDIKGAVEVTNTISSLIKKDKPDIKGALEVTNTISALIKEDKPDIKGAVEVTNTISALIKDEKPDNADAVEVTYAISALTKEEKPGIKDAVVFPEYDINLFETDVKKQCDDNKKEDFSDSPDYSSIGKRNSRRKRHKTVNIGEKSSSNCQHRTKYSLFKKELIQNNLITYGKKKFECRECGKKCLSARQLKLHKNIHRNKLNVCYVCGRVFKFHIHLTRHENTHRISKAIKREKEQYRCFLCEKSYKSRYSLKKHILLSHTCPVCDKTCLSNDQLIRHRIYHTENMKFSCKNCKKNFKARRYLLKHLEIHNAEKSFKCDKCYKSFRHKGNMVVHKITIHNPLHLTCVQCKEKFKSKRSLTQHKLMHDFQLWMTQKDNSTV